MSIRYLGFDQRQNMRAYRFKSMATGETNVNFIVTADLSLFLTHHVGIQEGPTLCARKLASDLESAALGEHQLTEQDLAAHSARTATELAQKGRSRRR